MIAAALALAAASPASQEGLDPSLHPEVVRVECLGVSGSAFRVGPDILLSVNHVTSNRGCFINGNPVTVLGSKGDFSVIRDGETTNNWLRIDCNGFVRGRRYVAIGYARGLPTLTEVDGVGTGDTSGAFSTIWGVFTVIPGQSGGAIIDADTGRVVGTVNVYDAARGFSGSIALKDTSVCRG